MSDEPYDVEVGILREVGRQTKYHDGNSERVAYVMSRDASQHGYSDEKLRRAIEDLRREGYLD